MTTAVPICPCCGFDIAQAEKVADGRFTFDPRSGFYVDGHRLRATPQVHELLGAIMRADGAPIKAAVLAERLGYDGDDGAGFVAVLLTNARRALAAISIPFPVETVRKVGLRWDLSAPVSSLTKHKVAAA